MRRINTAFAASLLLLAACSRQEEPVQPIAEIRGAPIAPAPSTNLVATQAVQVAVAPVAATAPTNLVSATATNQAPAEVNGYLQVGFDKLSSFHFVMPEETTPTNQPSADQFPPGIKALDKKPVSLSGFMLPLKVSKDW